ncbi:hypothetical protein MPL3356_60567 [Mesorhizobium plurifarium]|uniref:Uncharacterized protein n=1 Tax=Mesorhizobium plurifarium TaxID=69974 RepID=A0A090EA44_MESPL|nr:hypothetical protein MPL3356_60567 [Mesorhizobium plurifarium]
MTTIGKLLLAIRALIRRPAAHKSLAEWAAEMEADNVKHTEERAAAQRAGLNEAQANISKLPPICAAYLIADMSPIMIKAGEIGYYPAPHKLDVRIWNERRGIEPWHVNAMMAGSAFGWEIPAADCDEPSNRRCDPYKGTPWEKGAVAA